MKNKIIFSILSVVFLLGIKAMAYTPPLRQEEIKRLPHISATTAYYLFKAYKIFLLDVHDIPGKKTSKVIGAHYFPSKKIEKSKMRLPKKKVIGVF